MDRLTEMEAFATVVDQGGFTDAARKLGMSKSAVSKHVSALESRLGARLLHRTTRRVSPTEVGLAYYDRARRVLSDAGEADALVSELGAVPRGELTLLVTAEFGLAALVPLVASFLRRYPEIRVKIATDDAVAGERFDLSLRLGVPAEGLRVLAPFRQRLVASPGYLQRHGWPLRIDDLADHSLLHLVRPGEPGAWKLRAPSGEVREVRTGGPLAAADAAALRAAAMEGLGIARLPGFAVADALVEGSLAEVLAELPGDAEALVAEVAADRPQPAKVRVFLDHLEAGFAERATGRW